MSGKRLLFIFLIFPTVLFAQKKVVQKKFADGSPQVVYYYETYFIKSKLIKQEVYYENGHLEYSGEVKNDKENGEWIYYYENGKKKAHEHWLNGKETGIWKEYDESGKLIKESEYKSGKLIKTTNY